MWYYGGRIRIEPDWNVKPDFYLQTDPQLRIRIEPDWNVKFSIWLITTFFSPIRIEPDWNVKDYYDLVSIWDT